MKMTKTLPTLPGWYWWQNEEREDAPEVVHVRYDIDRGLFMADPRWPTTYNGAIPDGWYAGPLEVPTEYES